MSSRTPDDAPTRGHRKRERTRRQLIEAGLEVLAERGEAFTISDIAEKAGVSGGTFYNYFADREELVDRLAEHSLLTLATRTAIETRDEDPARRFASATTAILTRAAEEPTWGRVVLRLAEHEGALQHEIQRYLEEDLASGLEQGRFSVGPDPITLDLVLGLNTMAIRRIVRGDAPPDYVEQVVERALGVIGVPRREAKKLAREANA